MKALLIPVLGLVLAAPIMPSSIGGTPEFLDEVTEFYVPSALALPMESAAFEDCYGCEFCDELDKWVESTSAAEFNYLVYDSECRPGTFCNSELCSGFAFGPEQMKDIWDAATQGRVADLRALMAEHEGSVWGSAHHPPEAWRAIGHGARDGRPGCRVS